MKHYLLLINYKEVLERFLDANAIRIFVDNLVFTSFKKANFKKLFEW